MESNLILTSSIIEYCYYTRRGSGSKPWEHKGFQYLLETLLRRIGSVKKLLPTYDESLYHLLCILCDDKTRHSSSSLYLSSRELQQTIRQCGKQMSLRTLKKLQHMETRGVIICATILKSWAFACRTLLDTGKPQQEIAIMLHYRKIGVFKNQKDGSHRPKTGVLSQKHESRFGLSSFVKLREYVVNAKVVLTRKFSRF